MQCSVLEKDVVIGPTSIRIATCNHSRLLIATPYVTRMGITSGLMFTRTTIKVSGDWGMVKFDT